MIIATAIVSDGMGADTTLTANGLSAMRVLQDLSWRVENAMAGKKYTGRIAVTWDDKARDGLSAHCRNILQVECPTLFWKGTVEVI